MQIAVNCRIPHRYLSYPWEERVCLLIGRKRPCGYDIDWIVPVRNVAKNPSKDFAVSRRDYEHVASRLPVIGTVHSHLWNMNEWPSRNDLDGLPEGWIGAVYHPQYEDVWWYRRGEALDELVAQQPPHRSAA